MPAAPAAAVPPAALAVRGLKVVLPTGDVLIEDLSLEVRPGEVAVLLGGSGSGKSTFSRVLFEPETLERDGFELVAETLALDRASLGLVPQRGALFDHLDVRGNLTLATRYTPGDGLNFLTSGVPEAEKVKKLRPSPEEWLERVGLEPGLAGAEVGTLSGGQAQRVAVARALAGRRRILFLDEPSVGLDPHRVRMLARLVREQCATAGVAAIVVTHDVALAAGVADRLYVLDPRSRRLELLFGDAWPGPMERPDVDDAVRGGWLVRLERELVDRIAAGDGAPPRRRTATGRRAAALGRALRARLQPFAAAAVSLYHAPGQLVRHPGDFLAIAWRVARQAVIRPLLFYGVASVLIGYTVLYVISKVGGAGVRADAGIRLVGGSYVVALAPVLSAVLYVAASGNAVNAWLGSMGLTRQTLAMEALGVPTRAYLWAPAWVALGLGYLAVAGVFTLGMLAGGQALCRQLGVHDSWALLTSDLIDPRPERVKYVVRSAFLVWIYGWGIASDVVAKGGAAKQQADDVTHGMTRSVVACTLWVVAWELASAVAVFAR